MTNWILHVYTKLKNLYKLIHYEVFNLSSLNLLSVCKITFN